MVQHIAHLKPQGPGLPGLDLGGERKTAWRAPVVRKRQRGACITFPCSQVVAAQTAHLWPERKETEMLT